MKWIIVLTFILTVFVPSRTAPRPLYCPPPTVPDALKRAGAVFVGEVVEVIKPSTSDQNAPLPERFYTIRLKVEKVWKGVKDQEIKILAPTPGYETMPVPNKGNKYLVYADPAYTDEGLRYDWLIMGNWCNRTMLLSRANDDIKELDAIVNSRSKTITRRGITTHSTRARNSISFMLDLGHNVEGLSRGPG